MRYVLLLQAVPLRDQMILYTLPWKHLNFFFFSMRFTLSDWLEFCQGMPNMENMM